MDWLGIGSAVGGLFGDLWSTSSAQDAQMQMLEKQMEFSREAMQNHHQWEVADLKAAGLNPLMSVASPTGTLNSPTPAQVQKANLSQSALALGQLNIQEKFAKAAQTSADAEMVKANNDTDRTQFTIGPEFAMRLGLTEVQKENINASTNLIKSQEARQKLENDWLPLLYKADLNERQMRTATGYLMAYAYDYNQRVTADASMVSANAHVLQAQAYERYVSNVELMGVSQRYLNSQEARVAEEKARNIIEDTEFKRRVNIAENELFADPEFREARQAGRTFREFTGGSGLGSFVPW